MKILCDMDSILVNLCDLWWREYNEEFGDDLHMEKVVRWDTHEFAKGGFGVYKWLETPGNLIRCQPLAGAIEGLMQLTADGHDVLICTATQNAHAFGEKAQWVKDHIPGFSLKNLIITYRKDWVKADALIDDGPHNLKAYREAWPESFLVGIDYPYNRDCGKVVDIMARDWKDTTRAWGEIVDAFRSRG